MLIAMLNAGDRPFRARDHGDLDKAQDAISRLQWGNAHPNVDPDPAIVSSEGRIRLDTLGLAYI